MSSNSINRRCVFSDCSEKTYFILPPTDDGVGKTLSVEDVGAKFAEQVNDELNRCYDLRGGRATASVSEDNPEARARILQAVGQMTTQYDPAEIARAFQKGVFPEGMVKDYVRELNVVQTGQIRERDQCLPAAGSIKPRPPAQSPDAVYGRSEMPRTDASADKRTGLYKIGDWSCAPTMNKRTGTITSPVCEVSEAQLKQLYTLRLPHGGDGASPPVDRQADWVQKNICSVAPHVAPVRCGLKEAPVVTRTYSKNVGVQGEELYLKSLYEQADAFSPDMLDAIRQMPGYAARHEQISTAVQGRLRQAEEPRPLNPDDVTRAIYVVLKSRQEGGPYRETPDEAVVRLAERVSEGGWAFPETVEKHISREIDHRFP